ncbi:MAG: ATP-binding cassette domain-containing protein [Clostridia bacterium]|nr:ATP-binding cassette domain-containing protein [Clostridia bacterium]
MIELQHIDKSFLRGTPDENRIFSDFNFTVSDGEFVSVVGSNGSGKTTMLNLICGTYAPDGGKILFDGKEITSMPEHKRASFIGRVFQDPKAGTCSNLSILENMALADNKNKSYGLGIAVNKKRTDYYRSLLEQCNMGLEDRLRTKVGALCGGQRQALALVIANMTQLKLLILDEHTAALDPKSSERIMELTDKFVKQSGITALMVTHNLRFAVTYGTRLVMMHQGSVILDKSGADKENASIDDLLDKFNSISIELGN